MPEIRGEEIQSGLMVPRSTERMGSGPNAGEARDRLVAAHWREKSIILSADKSGYGLRETIHDAAA
jgi:hypothetical protein